MLNPSSMAAAHSLCRRNGDMVDGEGGDFVGEARLKGTIEPRIKCLVSEWVGAEVNSVRLGANPYKSRHRSGVASCTLARGNEVAVFWKLGPARGMESMGGLGCVGYEISVYRAIHALGDVPAPALIGGGRWGEDALLVLAYVNSGTRVQKSTGDGGLQAAAAQIGAFHKRAARNAGRVELKHYDACVLSRWCERASRNVPEAAWLRSVACDYPSLVSAIGSRNQTVIHGELYPDNVLVTPSGVVTVDWEWAGVGMGEIDLAALTEGWWGDDVIAACNSAYAQSRGLDAADDLFRQRLTAARLYLHLRCLGGRSGPPGGEEQVWRIAEAHAAAVELGLVPRSEGVT